ncbi:UNVERIFIED_CONTAM: hypothetical protein FKN15_065103 [Acipenser sinensis]
MTATPVVWPGACGLACKLPRAALSSDAVGGCMATAAAADPREATVAAADPREATAAAADPREATAAAADPREGNSGGGPLAMAAAAGAPLLPRTLCPVGDKRQPQVAELPPLQAAAVTPAGMFPLLADPREATAAAADPREANSGGEPLAMEAAAGAPLLPCTLYPVWNKRQPQAMRSNRQPQAMRSWHPWAVVETEAAPDALLQVGVVKAVVMVVKVVEVVSPTGILPLLVGLEVEVAPAPLLVSVGVVKEVAVWPAGLFLLLAEVGPADSLSLLEGEKPAGMPPLLAEVEAETAPAPLLMLGVIVVAVRGVKVMKAAGLPPLLAAKAAGLPPLLAAKAAGAPPLLAAKAAGAPPLLAAKAAGAPPLLAAAVKPAGMIPVLVAAMAAEPAGMLPLLVVVGPAGTLPLLAKVGPAGTPPLLVTVVGTETALAALLRPWEVVVEPAGTLPLLAKVGPAGTPPLLVTVVGTETALAALLRPWEVVVEPAGTLPLLAKVGPAGTPLPEVGSGCSRATRARPRRLPDPTPLPGIGWGRWPRCAQTPHNQGTTRPPHS